MPSWLVEDPKLVYLALGLIAVGLLVALWLKRERRWRFALIAGLVGVALLAVGVFLLDTFVVTDSEKILANLEGMRAGVQKRDASEVMKYVSKDFRWSTADRAWFEQHLTLALKSGVDDAVIFDVEPPVVDRAAKRATVSFVCKPKEHQGKDSVGDPRGYPVTATFVLDPDGEWRLQTFEALTPQDRMPITPSMVPW